MIFFPLQETLHNHKIDDDAPSPDESCDASKLLSHDPESHKATERNERPSLLKNWPLISSIIVYCIFSLHDMAYTEVLLLLFLQHSSLFIWPNMLKKILRFLSPVDIFIVGKQPQEIWRFGILLSRCWFCSCHFRCPYFSIHRHFH